MGPRKKLRRKSAASSRAHLSVASGPTAAVRVSAPLIEHVVMRGRSWISRSANVRRPWIAPTVIAGLLLRGGHVALRRPGAKRGRGQVRLPSLLDPVVRDRSGGAGGELPAPGRMNPLTGSRSTTPAPRMFYRGKGRKYFGLSSRRKNG